MKSKCSIVIVYHSDKIALDKCLVSIEKYAVDIHEVIIINNSYSKISIKPSKVKQIVINNVANIGFARACNQGAQVTKSDYILFLNPDTELTDNFINIGIEMLLNDDTIGLVAPALISKNGEYQKSAYRFPSIKNLFYETFFIDRIINRRSDFGNEPIVTSDNEIICVDWVSGAAMLMKKRDFIFIGGFNTRYFMYFEDVDLCEKIMKINKKVLYVQGNKIVHCDKELRDYYSPKFNSAKRIFYINKSIIEYWITNKKHTFIIRPLILIRSLLRIILWGIKYLFYWDNSQKQRIIGYGSVIYSIIWK
jgi:hypothetical protein